MRCVCNKILTPAESTRKFASGNYVDLCNKCLATIQDDVQLMDTEVFEEVENEDESEDEN